jgi:hypothetical protein
VSPWFWRNPEIVRHARAELRTPRVVAVVLLVLIVHALLAISLWNGGDAGAPGFFRRVYPWALGVQAIAFTLWCAIACGRAVPAERRARTWDFVRVTRLTPGELLIGKLIGEPIVAYFALACSVPFGAGAGLAAGFDADAVLGTYALIVALGIFAGLLGLFASLFLARGGGVVAALAIGLQLHSFSALAAHRSLAGFAALSVIPAVLELHGLGSGARPAIFGVPVPTALVSALLLAAFGGLAAVAIARNLKRDVASVVAFSRGQTLGAVALLNVLFYSLLDPAGAVSGQAVAPAAIAGAVVAFNAVLLFLSALVLVVPRETLRIWSQRYVAGKERYVSEVGPPWPWLVLIGGLGYALLLFEAFTLRTRMPLAEWPLAATATGLLVLLAFALRDLLFIQWCRLTRMRSPVTSAVLVLCLYYVAASVLAAAARNGSPRLFAYLLGFTPMPALLAAMDGTPIGTAACIGGVVQILPAALLLRGVSNRAKRPTAP